MEVALRERTEQTVRTYFERANTAKIKALLPQKAKTVEEALEDYRKTLLPEAASFGRTVYADGQYVGDVWCYGICREETPGAMVSYCIFEERLWGQGVATEAVRLFVAEISRKFRLKTLGAFTYAANQASIRVLLKNGFTLMEEFQEDGVLSQYFQLEIPENTGT